MGHLVFILQLLLMEDDQRFSPEQSLRVIQSMIEKAKQDVANNSFYFLLWGWLVFITAILNFILMRFTDIEHPYIVWNIMWVGVIASFVKGIKEGRSGKVKTYLGETMKYFGISMAIIYCSLAFIFGKYDLWHYSFPFYILIYAAACFFMGSMMQFSLLKWTGLLCIPIMIVSVFVKYEWQLLLMALAVLISYIIPGHMLSAKEKIQKN
jgi:hypothetical protein